MSEMPEKLKEAIAEWHRLNPPREPLPLTTNVGDLVVVDTGNDRAIVLITREFEGHPEYRQALLSSNDIDMAYDMTAIVRGATPYPLLIASELYCYIDTDKVVETVGYAPHVVGPLLDALFTKGESLAEFERGAPLCGVWDPRRRFMEEELDRLEPIRCVPGELLD